MQIVLASFAGIVHNLLMSLNEMHSSLVSDLATAQRAFERAVGDAAFAPAGDVIEERKMRAARVKFENAQRNLRNFEQLSAR